MSKIAIDNTVYYFTEESFDDLKKALLDLGITIKILEKTTRENLKKKNKRTIDYFYDCSLAYKGKKFDSSVSINCLAKNTLGLSYQRQKPEHVEVLEKALSSSFKLKEKNRYEEKESDIFILILFISLVVVVIAIFLYGAYSLIMKLIG